MTEVNKNYYPYIRQRSADFDLEGKTLNDLVNKLIEVRDKGEVPENARLYDDYIEFVWNSPETEEERLYRENREASEKAYRKVQYEKLKAEFDPS